MILRDRVNDLLQANADLEREVAKLRYAHSAMQAAENAQEDARSTRFVSSTNNLLDFGLREKFDIRATTTIQFVSSGIVSFVCCSSLTFNIQSVFSGLSQGFKDDVLKYSLGR